MEGESSVLDIKRLQPPLQRRGDRLYDFQQPGVASNTFLGRLAEQEAKQQAQDEHIAALSADLEREKKEVEIKDAYHNILQEQEQIKYEYSDPAAALKQDLVGRFLKQAPYTFRVSNPPVIHDLTGGTADPASLPCAPFREDNYKEIYNEPRVNEFMVKEGKQRIKLINELR